MARRLSEIRADLRLTRARAMAASLLDKPRHAETFMDLTIEAIEALSGDIHRLELGAAGARNVTL